MFFIYTDVLTKLLYPFPGKLICFMPEHNIIVQHMFLLSNFFSLCQIYFVWVDVAICRVATVREKSWKMKFFPGQGKVREFQF